MKSEKKIKRRVGIVGLGNAGSAIAQALLEFVNVEGFDTDPIARKKVFKKGVNVHHKLSTFVDAVDTIILSLPDPKISLAMTKNLVESENPPRLIIDTSTVTPNIAMDCAAVASKMNVAFVDAAIAGGVSSMKSGNMTFFLGGEEKSKALARPILNLVAENIYDLGKIGSGMGVKVVNNAVMHALMVVLIEAFAMSKKLGVPNRTLISILNREEGILRPLVHRIKDRINNGDFTGGMSVTNALKDSCLAIETAQNLGVPLFAISASHKPYEIAEAKGLGKVDYAALSELWEDWSDIVFKEALESE